MVDPGFYAAGVVLPGPSAAPGSNGYAPTWNTDGSFAGWSSIVLAHSGLTGLTSGDDHSQYALLAGRATPQTFAFGTAASATAGYLTSTAHATKGSYSLNSAGTMVVDELNLRLGLGVTPSTMLHIATNTTALGIITLEQASADTDSFDLNFRKTRGTVASPTVITTGDVLGTITAYGYSGAGGYVVGGQIRFTSTGTVATTRVPGKFTVALGTDAAPSVTTDRLTMTETDLIYLGNGATVFQINSNAGTRRAILQFYHGGTAKWDFGTSTVSDDSFHIREAATTDRFTIASTTGYIGINRASSIGAQLHVVSSSASTIGQIIAGATSHSVALLQLNMGATPTGNVFTITSSGGTEGDILKTTTIGNTVTAGYFQCTTGFYLNSNATNVGLFFGTGFAPALVRESATILQINSSTLNDLLDIRTRHSYNSYAAADTASSVHEFYKARGTVASPTVITTGDVLGTITGYGYSGAGGYVAGAQIRLESMGTVATTRVPGQIVFATGTDAAPTVMTDRWKINASGHLLAVTDNGVDIGASGATRPRIAYIRTSVIIGNSQELLITRVATNGNNFVTSLAGDHWIGSSSGTVGIGSDSAGTAQVLVRGGAVLFDVGLNGQSINIKTLTELLTIAASPTSTTTIQKPANSIVLAVNVRVTVALPITSTFTVGDSGSATRFSTAAVSKAINSTDAGTKAGAYYNATAEGIIITPDTTPSDATGRVRVTIFYIDSTPPTS